MTIIMVLFIYYEEPPYEVILASQKVTMPVYYFKPHLGHR